MVSIKEFSPFLLHSGAPPPIPLICALCLSTSFLFISAGKTTLMDVIAMRKTSGEITGDIHLNGHPQERTSFLRCSGYVEQFDIQQPELNIRETVEFCARLRLDGSDPAVGGLEGKLKYVDHVLETMELTSIQNLQVGSYEEGGLTFEQRKRLAIACELAGSPSVLFLGEYNIYSGLFWLALLYLKEIPFCLT